MKTTKRILAAATFAVATMASGFGQMAYNCEGCPPLAERTEVILSEVADADGNLPANYLMTCENLYILDRKIYPQVGSQVTILPGTVIKATFNGGVDASALIVPRGAKIYANGSECCPIIFTAMDDNLDGTFDIATQELWGGIIMLGYAHNTIAQNELNPENPTFLIGGVTNGVGFIEGTEPTDPRHIYGAEIALGVPFNNFDNSGVLNYVSLRHGGSELGETNEINGLTLGSVGSGTILRNIEVVANLDDGIEFFGGTVDLKYARVLYSGDDYLDWDQGYTGRIQHVVGVKRPGGVSADKKGDNGIEADGDDGTDFPRAWLSDPIVSNVTMIGRRLDHALDLKERTKGEIYNSIFANYNRGIAYVNALQDTVDIYNTTFANMVTNVHGTPPVGYEPTLPQFNNTFVASIAGMTTGDWTGGVWDAIPNTTGPAFDVNGLPDDPAKVAAGWYTADYYEWFDKVDYRGAYKPGASPWWSQNSCTMLQPYRADFESLVAFPAGTDLNGDGVTNVADLNILIGRFNRANNE